MKLWLIDQDASFVAASNSRALPGFHSCDYRWPHDMCLSLLNDPEADGRGISLPQPDVYSAFFCGQENNAAPRNLLDLCLTNP